MMTNFGDNHSRDQKPARPVYTALDKTAKLQRPDDYDGDDWTFRKKLESELIALGFKSRKFSHAKEPETRLGDSLWLTWHRKKSHEQNDKAIDNMDVKVAFDVDETIVLINCYGRGDRGCLPYRTDKLDLSIADNDTSELLHHIHHFLMKPKKQVRV